VGGQRGGGRGESVSWDASQTTHDVFFRF